MTHRDPQIEAYEGLPPGKYRRRARLVDLAMAHSQRPCLGRGCDLDDPCPRHQKTPAVASRFLRMRP